jgi:exodeoxyribonuclease VII large subunit
MMNTYLTTSYRDREKVKALGARWDADARRWYVLEGRDLVPFSAWLPADRPSSPSSSTLVAASSSDSSVGPALPDRGISLSALLAGIGQAVAQAFQAGVWTRVEVTKADLRRGHVYLELAERDTRGDLVAQARAVIWASTAESIIPVFERATGAQLGAGIKLLVRAKPTLHALYGLSLALDAIDPAYTLGDLEAKKRDIRLRLQREQLFDANRRLAPPWDYNSVLVLAPAGAAGLGDFKAEAERLERFDICRFVYVEARFQGEGAPQEMRSALLAVLDRLDAASLDAIVVIRGGGAVNDLAWLNDYELARCLCELTIPVLTGIGHERDSTILDEIAHVAFDTPSKVIHGIEQQIRHRTRDSLGYFESVMAAAERSVAAARGAAVQADAAVHAGAQRHIAAARHRSTELVSRARMDAFRIVRAASESIRLGYFKVQQTAALQLTRAKQMVPARFEEIRSEAKLAVQTARTEASRAISDVLDGARRDAQAAAEATDRAVADVTAQSARHIGDAAKSSEALMREIAGQGPEKTLVRGFAIVRTDEGCLVTGAAQVPAGSCLELQFRDGCLQVQTIPNMDES